MNSNRSVISANDVLAAMGELEFTDFVPELQETMECKFKRFAQLLVFMVYPLAFKKDKESKKEKKKKDE